MSHGRDRAGTARRFFSLKGIGETWLNAWKIAAYPDTKLFCLFTGPVALVYGALSTAIQLPGAIWNGGVEACNKVGDWSERRRQEKESSRKISVGRVDRELISKIRGEVPIFDEEAKLVQMHHIATGKRRSATEQDRKNEAAKKQDPALGKGQSSKVKGRLERLYTPEPPVGVTITSKDRRSYEAAAPSPNPKPSFGQQLVGLVRERGDGRA